eukprot:scaffold5311_cov120-Isochrysis_galbana.AAC.9
MPLYPRRARPDRLDAPTLFPFPRKDHPCRGGPSYLSPGLRDSPRQPAPAAAAAVKRRCTPRPRHASSTATTAARHASSTIDESPVVRLYNTADEPPPSSAPSALSVPSAASSSASK